MNTLLGIIMGAGLAVFFTLHILSNELGENGCVEWNDDILWCAKENPND